MRHKRDFKPGMCYHLISRVAHQEYYLNSEERARIIARMWRVAGFSGLAVLAYCVMSNHFHILVHVLESVELTDNELMDRVRMLYSGDRLEEVEKEWSLMASSPAGREGFRRKYLRRMGNVSEFMKAIKQNISMSINYRNVHAGTMWESRFYARAIDPSNKEALSAVAAYIDRNPVKAGLVTWPDAYEWCGFAAADKGDGRCVDAYRSIYSYLDTSEWKEIRETHGQVVARKIRELEEESGEGPTKLDLLVAGEKRGEILPRGIKDAAEVHMEKSSRLLARGSDKVAHEILALLREGPLRPAELRQALGIASSNFFTSHYLTPMESSGLIELAAGCTRFSSTKKFALTAKGRAALAAAPHH